MYSLGWNCVVEGLTVSMLLGFGGWKAGCSESERPEAGCSAGDGLAVRQWGFGEW